MRRSHPEQDLHIAVKQWLDAALLPEVLAIHVPNGESRDARTGAKLKAMGVMPGVADWLLCWSEGAIGVFVGWLELKSPIGRLTREQKAFRDRVQAIGHTYAVARSLAEVEGVISAWEVPTRIARRVA